MKKPLTPAAVARLFEKFAQSGYSYAKFTEPLYHALMHSFGFIAHFNRAGFYAARFATFDARVETLTTITKTGEWFSERPLEIALRAVVLDRGLLAAAVSNRDILVEMVERAELARLKAKYETIPTSLAEETQEPSGASMGEVAQVELDSRLEEVDPLS